MTDANRGQKKRLTIAATPEGIEKAEKALIRLGFDSKSNFAKSISVGKTAVDKFFTGQPIQLDTFKKICQELTLDWRAIAGITEPESSTPRERHPEASLAVGGEVATSRRQVTVVDAQTKQMKAVVVLEGDLDSLPNLTILTTILRAYSGDSINIVDIQQGSIRLIIEGSSEDIEKLLSRFEAGDLTELDGFPVEDLQILDDSSDDDRERPHSKRDWVRNFIGKIFSWQTSKKLKNKWDLVKEIVSRSVSGRKLGKADLSDADLRGADLSDADLRGADLSDADLSDADLRGADLSDADLSDADLRGANLSGADLSGANLRGANLSGANLSGANLNGDNLSWAKLGRAFLRRAFLGRRTKLKRTNLSWTNLSGANLSGANLGWANLSRANLIRANLIRANLIRANLSEANLSEANLSEANLRRANLSEANVFRTRFVNSVGISDSLKRDLIERGAIFEDSPNDRSRVLV